MDEVIFFRQPSDASRFLLFKLPRPPHPLAVSDDSALTDLCSPFGLLYRCTLQYHLKNATDDTQQAGQEESTSGEQSTAQPPISSTQPVISSSTTPQSQSQWASVHFFSIADAHSAKAALRRHFQRSGVRAVWSRTRRGGEDEEEGLDGVDVPRTKKFFPIAFHRCLEVINHFIGATKWNCAIKWIRRYDPLQDGDIVAGQSEEAASESEMEAFRALQKVGTFPCSFTCEVEFHWPGNGGGGLHVACRAHLALIRLDGKTYIRAFD